MIERRVFGVVQAGLARSTGVRLYEGADLLQRIDLGSYSMAVLEEWAPTAKAGDFQTLGRMVIFCHEVKDYETDVRGMDEGSGQGVTATMWVDTSRFA